MKESELLEAAKEKLSEDFPEYCAVCAAFFPERQRRMFIERRALHLGEYLKVSKEFSLSENFYNLFEENKNEDEEYEG
jgi:hypothetical protein